MIRKYEILNKESPTTRFFQVKGRNIIRPCAKTVRIVWVERQGGMSCQYTCMRRSES